MIAGEVSSCALPLHPSSHPVLADLKSLAFFSTSFNSPGLPSYPFALAHLCIQYSRNLPSDQTLLALGRQVSIASLQLSLHTNTIGVLDTLLPLASRLVRLDLTLWDLGKVAAAASVDPFLERCTQLKHLTSKGFIDSSIIQLTRSLESWTLPCYDPEDLVPILDVLNSKVAAISKLQCLRIHLQIASNVSAAVHEAQSWDGWAEIEEVCRRGKIRLSVEWRDEEQGEPMHT